LIKHQVIQTLEEVKVPKWSASRPVHIISGRRPVGKTRMEGWLGSGAHLDSKRKVAFSCWV